MTPEKFVMGRMRRAELLLHKAAEAIKALDEEREEYADWIEDTAIDDVQAELYKLRWTVRRATAYAEFQAQKAEYYKCLAAMSHIYANHTEAALKDLNNLNNTHQELERLQAIQIDYYKNKAERLEAELQAGYSEGE